MNLLQTARAIALLVVGVTLTLFVLASFLWLSFEARTLQIVGVGALLASMLSSLSRPRVSATLALAGSTTLSGSSYLAASDPSLAIVTGLAALSGTLLPILLGSIDARRKRQDKTERSEI